jgi:predicted transcriptional regulator
MAISRNVNVNTRISLIRLDQLERIAKANDVRPSVILRDALFEYMDKIDPIHNPIPPGE